MHIDIRSKALQALLVLFISSVAHADPKLYKKRSVETLTVNDREFGTRLEDVAGLELLGEMDIKEGPPPRRAQPECSGHFDPQEQNVYFGVQAMMTIYAYCAEDVADVRRLSGAFIFFDLDDPNVAKKIESLQNKISNKYGDVMTVYFPSEPVHESFLKPDLSLWCVPDDCTAGSHLWLISYRKPGVALMTYLSPQFERVFWTPKNRANEDLNAVLFPLFPSFYAKEVGPSLAREYAVRVRLAVVRLFSELHQPDRPAYWTGYLWGAMYAQHDNRFSTQAGLEKWQRMSESTDSYRRATGIGFQDGLSSLTAEELLQR